MVSARFRALTTRSAQLRYSHQVELVRAFVEAHLDRVQREVQPYPPVPGPPNHYQRTYKLHESWHRFGSTTSLLIDRTLVVGDANSPYARFVQGEQQMPYHEMHGWKKLSNYLHRDEFTAGVRAIYSSIRIDST